MELVRAVAWTTTLQRCVMKQKQPRVNTRTVLSFNPSNSTKERKAEARALLPFDTGGYSSCSQQSLQLLRELKQQQASVRNTQARLPVSKLAENHQTQK